MSNVVAIYIANAHGGRMQAVSSAEAVADKGLRGDRYFESGKPHKAVTFISCEALEHLEGHAGIALTADQSRRNILTQGIDLNAWVGRQFRVGAVTFEGFELCEPCQTLEDQTQKGVIRGLTHRGGLRARVISGGTIWVADIMESVL